MSAEEKAIPTSSVRPRDSPPWFASPSGADYDESLRRRLSALLDFKHLPSNRFAVSVTPSDLKWPKHGDDTLLTYEGRPITVLLVGEIAKHFLHKDGRPIKYVSLNLHPVDNASHQAATTLLEKHARFTTPTSTSKAQDDNSIRVSCPTSRKDRHGLVENYLFNEIYDARTGYGPKSGMPSYAVDRVGTNDLIVAECTVQRYHVSVTGSIEYGMTEWSRWKTGYHLVAFSILNVGELNEAQPQSSLPDDDMPTI